MKFLLLNPPGPLLFLRDYYCSTVSKGSYVWHPIELLVLSGLLKDRGEVFVLDCIVERLKPAAAFKKVHNIKPDVIIFLSSTLSFKDDLIFMGDIKKIFPSVILIGAGEVFLIDKYFENAGFIDAAMRNFINKDLLFFLDGQHERINSMIYKSAGRIISRYARASGEFEIKMPCHNLFPKNRYWMPFVSIPFASVMTDFGCRFNCLFCNSNFFGYAERSLNNIIEELVYVRDCGFKHVFFKDMTFGSNQKRLVRLLDIIKKSMLNMTFSCYSRVDILDEEILVSMKRAGFKLIQFGVENPEDSVLSSNKKGITIERIKKTFQLCKQVGIMAGAHFIIGLPFETDNGISGMVNFAKQLKPCYASFNTFTVRIGSGYFCRIFRHDMSLNDIDKTVSPKKELIESQKLAYRKYYFSPAALMSSLKYPYKCSPRFFFDNAFNLCKNFID